MPCFVARGTVIETGTVSAGRQNEVRVQVLAGLEEGETVLLSLPPGFEAEFGLPS